MPSVLSTTPIGDALASGYGAGARTMSVGRSA